MARRNRLRVANPEQRQSIGDAHVDSAVGHLKRTAQITAGVMASYQPTREATLSMLFRDDDIAKLKAVRGMVETANTVKSYTIVDGVDLSINFRDALVPAIEEDVMCMHPERIAPLLTFIAEVRAVHDRFEEVKGVLRWMNRNATPGAIRYYWPTAMKLCPQSRIWEDLQEVPTRYTTPEKIGDWSQSIKDAAATVAGAAMLPSEATPRDRGLMWLTFQSRTVELSARSNYETDMMVYNL